MPDPADTGRGLPARVNVITLGVADLERALAFYRDALGLPTSGITAAAFAGDERNAAGAVVMVTLEDGLVLALYPRSELAKDAGVDPSMTAGSGLSIGQLVESRAEVDRILELATAGGAGIPAPARERPWGIYSGYFIDPDGHLWEIIHAPARAEPD